MPLTTSHPAAVVLIRRLNLDLSAMVIGSMTPDFVYFIPGCLPLSDFSHTLIGILVLGIPLGLAVLSIFQYLIKYPALSLLPADHQSRLFRVTCPYNFFPLKRFMLISASVLIGELTHIIWDSFTHLDGWVVMRVDILKSHLTIPVLTGVPVYLVLQHGSTVVGMLLIALWYTSWYRKAVSVRVHDSEVISPHCKVKIIAVMIVAAGLIATISAFSRVSILQSTLVRLDFFRVGYITLMVSLVVEIVLFGLLRRVRQSIQANKILE